MEATKTHLLERPFELLGPDVGYGAEAPAGWISLRQLPLVVLVGLTGAGKTTAQNHLQQSALPFVVLPERRWLTERLIIAPLQEAEGLSGTTPSRIDRLRYTMRYRELVPGGMAAILSQLWLHPDLAGRPVLFDGLRGENEVRHAAQALPEALFLMLDTPDIVRVKRLLLRQDAFDQLGQAPQVLATPEQAKVDLPEAAALLTTHEREQLQLLVQTGRVTADELRSALKLVLEERRNYDPIATRKALIEHALNRTLVIYTEAHSIEDELRLILEFLSERLPVAEGAVYVAG